MKLIIGVMVLITYDQVGKWLMQSLDWPIPGSVVGMMLLFISLVLLPKPPAALVQSSKFLLRHLGLLFVPAGVGIMLLYDLVADEWLAMLVSMVLSTFVSLVFTAYLMQAMIPVDGTEESDGN
ncbi:CidA/LrgA family protein [Marinicella sp. S1101]|uniref:CidA/LrgA family protein n=1 Tax=Marinicella marina TaxID=2996016 RepID=UPI002260F706|nr:CidA/LrgA family protein [Marinicella marina]MCX7552396.1 CidA/LrgA family protein [Marinicella marina]MDJ1139271.1 CidA/LrgA family protein [Marinicella marina]